MIRSRIFLHSAPLLLCAVALHTAGAQSISLTDGIPGGGFVISPDQSRLIFGGPDGLYSARIDGVGSPLRISPENQSSFWTQSSFSPDSSWFVFKNNRFIEEVRHLDIYSARADGSGTPVLLNSFVLPL